MIHNFVTPVVSGYRLLLSAEASHDTDISKSLQKLRVSRDSLHDCELVDDYSCSKARHAGGDGSFGPSADSFS